MGLFSKKVPEPVAHPPVERIAHVAADLAAVRLRLDEYGTLWPPKRAASHTLHLATSGGWTAVRLPDAVHPWQLHNLAIWLLDCPGVDGRVFAVSAPAPTHPGYTLTLDPEVPDALCGWDSNGDGWTVSVPSNEVVRPEAVPVDRVLAVPTGFGPWEPVEVLLEDPGAAMNPTNAPDVPSRERLRRRHAY